jgi:hypothetical protein
MLVSRKDMHRARKTYRRHLTTLSEFGWITNYSIFGTDLQTTINYLYGTDSEIDLSPYNAAKVRILCKYSDPRTLYILLKAASLKYKEADQ